MEGEARRTYCGCHVLAAGEGRGKGNRDNLPQKDQPQEREPATGQGAVRSLETFGLWED